MKTTLLAATLFVSLAATSAFADDCEHGATPVYNQNYQQPRGGRYQLQNVQKWIPGRYVSVNVPNCRPNHWGQVRCHSMTVRSEWQTGHYETVQEYVWVVDTYKYDRPGNGYRRGYDNSGTDYRRSYGNYGSGVSFTFGVHP